MKTIAVAKKPCWLMIILAAIFAITLAAPLPSMADNHKTKHNKEMDEKRMEKKNKYLKKHKEHLEQYDKKYQDNRADSLDRMNEHHDEYKNLGR